MLTYRKNFTSLILPFPYFSRILNRSLTSVIKTELHKSLTHLHLLLFPNLPQSLPISSMATFVPVFISSDSLHSILTRQSPTNHFQSSLPNVSTSIQSPIRQNYAVPPSSSLLLMPSWSSSPSFPYIGLKLVTHFPQNSAINLPGVQATYVLFSSTTGQPLASMDATELTLYRTSCVSGLASKYLARPDSEVLVMVGARAMAPHLIRAHIAAIPSLRKVMIWNRTEDKARKLAKKMRESDDVGFEGVSCEGNECLEEIVGDGDIVSCAINSEVERICKDIKLTKGRE